MRQPERALTGIGSSLRVATRIGPSWPRRAFNTQAVWSSACAVVVAESIVEHDHPAAARRALNVQRTRKTSCIARGLTGSTRRWDRHNRLTSIVQLDAASRLTGGPTGNCGRPSDAYQEGDHENPKASLKVVCEESQHIRRHFAENGQLKSIQDLGGSPER